MKITKLVLSLFAATLISGAAFAQGPMPVRVSINPAPPVNSVNYHPNFTTLREEQRALKRCLGSEFMNYSREIQFWNGAPTRLNQLVHVRFHALEPTTGDARLAIDSEYESTDKLQFGTFLQTLRNTEGQQLFVWLRYEAYRTIYIDPVTDQPVGTAIHCDIHSPTPNGGYFGAENTMGIIIVRNQAGRVVYSESTSSPR